MNKNPDRLYELLPVVYREKDAAEGYPLRALLRVVARQVTLVEQDIEKLWDDQFIEVCSQWVIPYIGDLVGNRLLYDASRAESDITAKRLFTDLFGPDLRPPVAVRTRADVAKTIYYRRRKGTLPMLEELARDVTGWPAHAVEFFELLGWTQHREHIRFQSRWTEVRSPERMGRINGPFDEASHTVDVRRIAQPEGWYNIHNIGFFLYRLLSYRLSNVPARVAGSAPWRYHFSPLGNPAPLFSRWRREGSESGLSTEFHVPAPIRPAFFYEDLERYANRPAPPARPDFTDLYGLPDPVPGDPTGVCPECSFFIRRNGASVVPAQDPNAPPATFDPQVVCRQLNPWPVAQPAGPVIAVDVGSGRIAIGDGWPDATENVDVYYHYGFASDLGGGPYERQKWLVKTPGLLRLFVLDGVAPGSVPDTYPTLADALNDWITVFARRDAIITILDSRNYEWPAAVTLTNEGFLAIEAANGQRPLLQTQATGLQVLTLPPAIPGDPDRRASLTLNGIVLEGHLHLAGDLSRLRILHSTLVPGRRLDEDGLPLSNGPSIDVDAGPPGGLLNVQLRIEIAFSILGPLTIPQHAEGVWILDSVVDAFAPGGAAFAGPGGPGPNLFLERSTLFGELSARSLEMSESIATGHVDVVRTQEGCVRFSYVPPGSHTPRRYLCQPDLAVEKAIEEALKANPGLSDLERAQIASFVHGFLVPGFTATLYGQPAYAQLREGCPMQIRTGAEDGSEMGVFSHLKQPQREGNLRLRLDEYLPFGLEAGILFAT